MNCQVVLYDIKENGICKADISIKDINLFIRGFRVVPGQYGRGIIVHMPKGMGTDWKYDGIEWKSVREKIIKQYLEEPVTRSIYNSLGKTQDTSTNNKDSAASEIFVNLYNFDSKTGSCQAGIILPVNKTRIEGFSVNNTKTGLSIIMPKSLDSQWTHNEISWKTVQKEIRDKYLKEQSYIKNNIFEKDNKSNEFNVWFHDLKIEYNYDLYIIQNKENIRLKTILIDKGSEISIINSAELSEMIDRNNYDYARIEKLCEKAFFDNTVLVDEKYDLTIDLGECIGQITSAKVDFFLPNSSHYWKNFYLRELADGSIQFRTPMSLKDRWHNDDYPWNVLSEMVRKAYFHYKDEINGNLIQKNKGTANNTKDNIEGIIKPNNEIVDKPEEKEKSADGKQIKKLNKMGRVKNADSAPFVFRPHSILKIVPNKTANNNKNRVGQLSYAINNPNGGIGPFEIEILVWISRFKYAVKSMILDLALSGCIVTGANRKINADKMTDIMDRLYKYDLIETSRFISVDDNGDPLEEGKQAKYRVHTLGATGYNLLKEIGRQPERRSPFSILADGNTVKKQLAANQWLVYWLTHYSSNDILDYSINQKIDMIGPEWNGAKIYAIIYLETCTIIAEPIRRCEDFELSRHTEEINEKLLRLTELLDNIDKLYNSYRQQIVFPSRPIICLICEDDEHMNEIARNTEDLVKNNKQQDFWFTTDSRMYNYDYCGNRMNRLNNSKIESIDLCSVIGIDEMSMEERGECKTT